MDKRKIQMAVLEAIEKDMDSRIVDRMRPKAAPVMEGEALPDDETEELEMIPGDISDDAYLDESPEHMDAINPGGDAGIEELKSMLNEPIPEGADEATPEELDAKYAAGRKFGRR